MWSNAIELDCGNHSSTTPLLFRFVRFPPPTHLGFTPSISLTFPLFASSKPHGRTPARGTGIHHKPWLASHLREMGDKSMTF